MNRRLLILLLTLACAVAPVAAVEFRSGDDVVIARAIDDDLFASGGTIAVNAPVESLTAAGGMIEVNAPVHGDVILAGGSVIIKAPVDGKVIAAGGEIQIDDQVATNAVMAGGQVTIGENAIIGRDAYISGGDVQNSGTVTGNLVVSGGTFENMGSAGNVKFEQTKTDAGDTFPIFEILMTMGFLITGLLLIKYFSGPFTAVSYAIRADPVKATLLGLGVVLISALLIILLAVSLIGIPIALLMTLVLGVVILLSGLFVSSWIGDLVVGRLHITTNAYGAFIIGFVILHLLFLIPVLGALLRILTWAMGTGAFALSARDMAQEPA